MAKNILTLNSQEAMDFFMKSEQYHSFELPEYFTFDQVLKYVRETIGVINNWWNSMEQRSIELSLEYRYMFVTDITNCYGSFNPQTFDWAFTLKGTSLETEDESIIAKNIQKYLCAFS